MFVIAIVAVPVRVRIHPPTQTGQNQQIFRILHKIDTRTKLKHIHERVYHHHPSLYFSFLFCRSGRTGGSGCSRFVVKVKVACNLCGKHIFHDKDFFLFRVSQKRGNRCFEFSWQIREKESSRAMERKHDFSFLFMSFDNWDHRCSNTTTHFCQIR